MPINWGLMDTQYPQKLSDLFNPASIQQRQIAASDQHTMNQLRQAQLMQAAQGLKRQPELARREDAQYQAQQEQMQAQQANAMRRQKLMEQLNAPNVPPQIKQQILTQLFPEEAAKQAFKPPVTPKDWENPAYQKYEQDKARFAAGLKPPSGAEPQRGQIVFDNQGKAFNVNPYTNEVRPVAMGEKQIQAAQYSPGLQGQIAGAKASGKETGTAMGESVVKLQDMESMMPRLEVVTAELSELGKKATYTLAGQGANTTRRQLGIGVGEGAVARKEYISKVDNEILPLLRQTFGAQFTQKEGESLKATLGDTNASPEEKDAVLKSFIETKYGQIAGLKRRTNAGAQPSAPTKTQSGATASGW